MARAAVSLVVTSALVLALACSTSGAASPPSPDSDAPSASGPRPAAVACEMAELLRHGDPAQTRIHGSSSGTASLYFRAKLDVNTDGAARSYHPDDPRATRLALNNIANAITAIHSSAGVRNDCEPRSGACFTRYIETFEAARDARWDGNGHPRVETDGIIPWTRDATLGRDVPCTIRAGPHAGYFVSQTSFLADPSKPICDAERYLDSMRFDAIVLPRRTSWQAGGATAGEGDLVVVRNPSSGRTRFAIVGDRGPAKKLGEGSIALAAGLNGRVLTGEELQADIRRLTLAEVEYVIFPADAIRDSVPGAISQSDIDRLGAARFASWGGAARLDACRALPK